MISNSIFLFFHLQRHTELDSILSIFIYHGLPQRYTQNGFQPQHAFNMGKKDFETSSKDVWENNICLSYSDLRLGTAINCALSRHIQ